jgi:hypothetical protein
MTKFGCIATLAICLFSCSKEDTQPPYQEPPHTKKVTFKVYQAADYSSQVYDSTYAEVILGIYKISLTDTGRTAAWDTVLKRQRLRLFPLSAQPLVITKSIANVYEQQQRVRIYTITKYDNQGTNQVGGSNMPFTAGTDTMQVNVML